MHGENLKLGPTLKPLFIKAGRRILYQNLSKK